MHSRYCSSNWKKPWHAHPRIRERLSSTLMLTAPRRPEPVNGQKESQERTSDDEPQIGDDHLARNRHQVYFQGYELVGFHGRVGGVAQQFQKCASTGIATDDHPAPVLLRVNVNQVLGLRRSGENRVRCVTQPQRRDAFLIVGVGLLGRSFELWSAGKRAQLRVKADEV